MSDILSYEEQELLIDGFIRNNSILIITQSVATYGKGNGTSYNNENIVKIACVRPIVFDHIIMMKNKMLCKSKNKF